MSQVITSQVDASKMKLLMADLQQVLIKSNNSDASEVVGDESRRLALECYRMAPPKSQAALNKSIEKSVKSFFQPQFKKTLLKKKQGKGDLQWLVAGPKFLLGIQPANNLTTGGVDALRLHRKLRGRKVNFGKARTELGIVKHSRQRAFRINRLLIPRKDYAALVKNLKSRAGRFKASWAETASLLGETKFPGWVTRHFPTPKSIHQLEQLRSDNPTVTFGSRAPGVRHQTAKVHAAMQRRIHAIKARIKHILRGYKKDVANRQRLQKRGKESASASS
jgi:hypothetical protein